MKPINFKRLSVILILITGLLATTNAQKAAKSLESKSATEHLKQVNKTKVTFIELGSVQCIPCKKMQPIMKSIEAKFGTQIKVVFYDVWTPFGKTYADKFNVNLIPTQVFLDEKGKEFFRHEGFFPEEGLIKILKTKGVH